MRGRLARSRRTPLVRFGTSEFDSRERERGRFHSALTILQRSRLKRSPSPSLSTRRCFSSQSRPSFGITFDIDGVVLRGHAPVAGASEALRRLYNDSGSLSIPFLFLTNGGGIRESKRAEELSQQLAIKISPQQVVQGHAPFKELVNRFENELIIAVGKGEPVDVMTEYGFKNVLSIDEYASYFDGIDPLAAYKIWKTSSQLDNEETRACEPPQSRKNVFSERVRAVFVVSDPVDWGRDIQVMCDILRTGGLPGVGNGNQPPLYFANDDLEYQAAFPSNRLGMSAYRIALESIFNRCHGTALQFTSFGKPNPCVYQNATNILSRLPLVPKGDYSGHSGSNGSPPFKTIYMVGDNPSVDINGARQAGRPWFSILTRTGVFKGKENDPLFPADLVVDDVADAIDYILRKEMVA